MMVSAVNLANASSGLARSLATILEELEVRYQEL